MSSFLTVKVFTTGFGVFTAVVTTITQITILKGAIMIGFVGYYGMMRRILIQITALNLFHCCKCSQVCIKS